MKLFQSPSAAGIFNLDSALSENANGLSAQPTPPVPDAGSVETDFRDAPRPGLSDSLIMHANPN
jgi:hypothetical protein